MKFISDLNKLVNTIDKVDKLLTEKPKKKSIMVPLSEKEILILQEWHKYIYEPLMKKCDDQNLNWHQQIKPHQDLYDKLIRYKKKFVGS